MELAKNWTLSRSHALRGNAVTACYAVLFAPQRGEKAFPRGAWERVERAENRDR